MTAEPLETPSPTAPEGRGNRGRMIVSAVTVLGGFGLVAASWDVDRGDLAHPGPGLYPLVVGVLAILAGATGLVEERRSAPSAAGTSVAADPKPWIFVAAMSVGIIALPTLGYLVSALITGTAVSWAAGQRTWWKALLTGAVLAVVSSLVFRDLLDVYLPASVIDELI